LYAKKSVTFGIKPFLEGIVGGRGSAMVPFERAIVLSYRLSIMTIALRYLLIIRPQFAVECLRRTNKQRG